MFRFRKNQLERLLPLLRLPPQLKLSGGAKTGHVQSEFAVLFMLYRLAFPSRLISDQDSWGCDFSTLSRVFNAALNVCFDLHQMKVCENIAWYGERFDLYRHSIQAKIIKSPLNPVQNRIPQSLSDVFGFIDGTAREICRPGGGIQNPFWNGYHHGHFLMYQGVSFPDGMVVISGPEPGYYTDLMLWRDCRLRVDLEAMMAA